MKKWYLLFLLIPLVFLTSCDKDPIIDPPIEGCTEDQLEVNDECVTLSTDEWVLYNTFTNLNTLSNYQVTVSTSEDEETFDFMIQYSENITKYIDANSETYYVNDDGSCKKIVVQFGQTTEYSIDCPTANNTLFYKDLTYDMFENTGASYELKDSFIPVLSTYFETLTLQGMSITIQDNYISTMTISIIYENTVYDLHYTFSEIGNVTITLPTE